MIITEGERKKKGEHYPELGSCRGGLLINTLMNGLGEFEQPRIHKRSPAQSQEETGHESA